MYLGTISIVYSFKFKSCVLNSEVVQKFKVKVLWKRVWYTGLKSEVFGSILNIKRENFHF